MLLNEADRRAELIDPKLKGADWTDEIIQREFQITAGKVNIFGDRVEWEDKKIADYLLTNGLCPPLQWWVGGVLSSEKIRSICS